MITPLHLLIATFIVVVILLLTFVYVLIAIRDMKDSVLGEYTKVTRILGTKDVASKPTRYEAGDIVIVRDTRTSECYVVHLRNVYCRNKEWLYSGIKIAFIEAPSKFGVRKIPTYITTVSGISDKDITPIDDISMKVFKWKQEDL